METNNLIFDLNNIIVATKPRTLEDCKRTASPYANQITWLDDMELPMLLPDEFSVGAIFEFAVLNNDKTKYIYLSQFANANRPVYDVATNAEKLMTFKRFLRICPFHAPKEFTKSHKKNGIGFAELVDINSRLVRDQLSDINFQLYMIQAKKQANLNRIKTEKYLDF